MADLQAKPYALDPHFKAELTETERTRMIVDLAKGQETTNVTLDTLLSIVNLLDDRIKMLQARVDLLEGRKLDS